MARNPSISLIDHQQRFVSSLIESGRYHGASEVVRDGLRMLEDREEKRRAVIARLEAAVEEGLRSGESTPVESIDAFIAEFEREPPA